MLLNNKEENLFIPTYLIQRWTQGNLVKASVAPKHQKVAK